MYCPKCGRQIEQNVLFCPWCGKSTAELFSAPAQAEPVKPAKTPGFSIASLACGAVGIAAVAASAIAASGGGRLRPDTAATVFFALAVALAAAATAFGVIGIVRSVKTGEKKRVLKA